MAKRILTGRAVCTGRIPCDYHRDGGPASAKCPGLCSTRDCMRRSTRSVGGRWYCARHPLPRGGVRVGAGRPATLGADASIGFRVAAADRARGEAIAEAEQVTISELARRAYLACIGDR